MTTPDVHRATIICTPAYREWLRAKYTFSMKPQPVVGNMVAKRLRSGVVMLVFGYAW